MAEQKFHAGGEGAALVDGVDYGGTGWDATETVQVAASTSTKNYSPTKNMTFTQREPTEAQLTGSFKINYDSNQEPFPNLSAGKKVGLKLYRAYLGQNINCPKALITSTPISNSGTNGIFEITINWESYGEYDMYQ